MSGHTHQEKRRSRGVRARQRGQAMTEYVIIAVFVMLAIIVAVTATGPAVGNIFSNTVNNLLGQTLTPYATWDANTVATYAKAYSQFTPPPRVFQTNTPPAPTCSLAPGVFATPNGSGGFISC